MNKIIITGRLTRDVELKHLTNGTAFLKMSVAVARKFRKEGEPEADFINCAAFGKTAEFISKYFSKGKMIAIVGRIQTGSYKKQDGSTAYTTEVIIEEVDFCGSKEDSTKKSTTNNDSEYYAIEEVEEDELPF